MKIVTLMIPLLAYKFEWKSQIKTNLICQVLKTVTAH